MRGRRARASAFIYVPLGHMQWRNLEGVVFVCRPYRAIEASCRSLYSQILGDGSTYSGVLMSWELPSSTVRPRNRKVSRAFHGILCL